ncbi:unnamed protein product [Scytosiphon promiscuus]
MPKALLFDLQWPMSRSAGVMVRVQRYVDFISNICRDPLLTCSLIFPGHVVFLSDALLLSVLSQREGSPGALWLLDLRSIGDHNPPSATAGDGRVNVSVCCAPQGVW